jgi:hypothetical protein
MHQTLRCTRHVDRPSVSLSRGCARPGNSRSPRPMSLGMGDLHTASRAGRVSGSRSSRRSGRRGWGGHRTPSPRSRCPTVPLSHTVARASRMMAVSVDAGEPVTSTRRITARSLLSDRQRRIMRRGGLVMSKVGTSAVRCLYGRRPSSVPAGWNPGVPAAAPCRPGHVWQMAGALLADKPEPVIYPTGSWGSAEADRPPSRHVPGGTRIRPESPSRPRRTQRGTRPTHAASEMGREFAVQIVHRRVLPFRSPILREPSDGA